MRVSPNRQRLGVLLFAVLFFFSGAVLAQTAPKADANKAAAAPEKPKPTPPKRGLQVNDPRALQGYTLVAPIMTNKTYLVDMQGHVVRSWESESSGASSSYLLENGHLLRLAKLSQQAFGDGPGAAGHVQEVDWDGNIVWDFKLASPKQLSHHDICRMPNGNLLMVAWDKKSAQEAVAAGRRPETVSGNMIPDSVVEIKPTGKNGGEIVWEWHAWDHLIQDHDSTKANFGDVATHPELIDVNFGEGVLASIVAKKEELDKLRAIGYVGSTTPGAKPGPVRADWMHVNAVSYHPEFDQVLLSSPEFNEFWIIDHSTTTAEAAGHQGGRSGKGGDLLYRWGNPRAYRAGTVKDQKLFYQHNVHWIPKGYPGEGHILVFNNGRRRPGGAHSSVDELILPVEPDGRYVHKPSAAYGPDAPIWSYVAPKRSDFYAEFISGANRLPNGNTLICAGPSGTIFEVTPDKETVWKYLNPAKPSQQAGAPSRPVDVVASFLRELIKATPEQDKELDALADEVEIKLLAILTAEQKTKVKEPLRSFGPPGMPTPAATPTPIQVLARNRRTQLKLTDAQKKQVDDLQKEAETRLDKLLSAEQKKQLKDVHDGFVSGWGGGGPPGGPGGPGGRPPGGPGGMAPPIGAGLPALGNSVFRSYRYAANYPGLAGKDLTPGKTIEELESTESANKKQGQ
jgi:hypothetical protein